MLPGGLGGGVFYKFVYNCLPASLTTVRLLWLFLVGGCCFCCFLLNYIDHQLYLVLERSVRLIIGSTIGGGGRMPNTQRVTLYSLQLQSVRLRMRSLNDW